MREAIIAESRATPLVTYGNIEQWADAWMEPPESDAGVKVNRKTAWYVPAVWQLGSMISGDVAKLPLDVFKYGETDDDIRTYDEFHPAAFLVRHRPNRNEHAFYFWRDMMCSALLLGAGYAWIERNKRGEPTSLTWLDPDRVTPEILGGELIFSYETIRDGQPYKRAIPNEDMFHIRGMSFDGSIGASMVYYSRHTLGLAIARQRYASKFFKNGAKMGGFLMYPPGVTPEFKRNVQKGYDEAVNDEKKWQSPLGLYDGVKWQPNMVDPRTGQMVEQGEAVVREVCRYFNVSPSRAGLSDSVSYNSKTEDNQSYLDTTLSPWLRSIEAEANMKLLSERQQRSNSHYFEFNVKALLKMNAKDEATVLGMMAQNGVINPNEWRRLLNMPPREGGDEYKSIQAASPAGGFDKGGNDAPRGPGDGDSQLDRSNPNRRQKIQEIDETFKLANVAVKAARKGYQDFGKFVQSRLPKYKDIPLRRALAEADKFPVDSLASEVERICNEHKEAVCG